MEEKFEYIGKDKLGGDVKVYFEVEPRVYKGMCLSTGTLQIDRYNSVHFQLRLNPVDSNELNSIKIVDLRGGKSTESLQWRYGTILMTALFEYAIYLEKRLEISIYEIYGELEQKDKENYITKTNGKRRLTNFYEDVIKYLPADINKNITITFYKDNYKSDIDLKDIDNAVAFKYFMTNK